MPFVLEIYELARQIASYLSTADALALAKTCRSTSNPALDELWMDLASFKPLLALLPPAFLNLQGEALSVSIVCT